MKGLIIKDIFNLRQQAKTYLLILAIWVVIAVANHDASFFSGLIMMFSILLPVTSFSYDEKSKWERYALSMPISRRDVVFSKYLLALICALACLLISFAVSIIISGNVAESFLTSIVFVGIAMVVVSIIMPFIIAFGVEKARTVMLVIFILPSVSLMLASRLGIEMPGKEVLDIIAIAAPFAAIIIVAASVFISVRAYEKKDL